MSPGEGRITAYNCTFFACDVSVDYSLAHSRSNDELSSFTLGSTPRLSVCLSVSLPRHRNDRRVAREDRKRHSTDDAGDGSGGAGRETRVQSNVGSSATGITVSIRALSSALVWKHVTSMPSVHGRRSTA